MRDTLLKFIYDNAASGTDVAFSYKRRLRRRRWTYAGLSEGSFQFARELEERNIGKGDRVLIWAENCPEWVVAFYGSLLRGAILVPLDEQSAPDFVARVSEETDPKLLLYGTRVDAAGLNLPRLSLEDLSETIAHHSKESYPAQNISRNDTVEIVFTSGTTSTPKGVQLTHDNILSNVEVLERVIKRYRKWEFLVHPIRILSLLPLSHVFGQVMGIFVPPLLTAEVVFLNHLNASEITRTIRRERVSVVAAVPRQLETLRHKIERWFEEKGKLDEFRRQLEEARHWSALKKWWKFRRVHRLFGLKFWSFVTGGSTLPASTEEFWGRLGFMVVQGYGMTETAALVSLNNPFSAQRGSLGQVLGGQEVKIDEGGEILVRGKNVSAGYWGEEKEPGGEDWLRTGDEGWLDESGRLYFKGRKKDVIVTSAGLKIYPEDLEAALDRQPEIRGSAVVGVDGADGPEAVAALILREGSDATLAVAKANKSLAPYQQIRRWFVWPEPDFPRTPTQKIRKTEIAQVIRQNLGAGAGGGEGEDATKQESLLTDIIASLGKGKSAGGRLAAARLSEDLNLDSLARVELLSAVEERFQIDLDERAFTEATTVGDVEEMIRSRGGKITRLPKFSYPRWSLGFPARWFRVAFYYSLILPITLVLCRVKVRGLEHISALEAPVIFASNHVTRVDPPIIMSALPHRFRSRLAIAMDGEMLEGYRHPPAGTPWLARVRLFFQYWLVTALFNVFPLPRRSGFRESFNYAGEAMDGGYNVLIFPEGETAKEARLQKFQSGVGVLESGLEAAVVPISITGLYELKAEGRRFFARPGSVTIAFGQPIPFDPEESPAKIAQKLEEQIAKLLLTNA